jgi:hypothetical protein
METARRYADSLQSQPGVAGILLYGSLSSGDPPELTPFSDVDVALVLDREMPAHFTEHRLVNGVKVDVLLFHRDTLRDLVARQPERLYQGGWVLHFLIKSLLLGTPETILYDPSDELAATKRALNERTTYAAMARADAEKWLPDIEREQLAAAEKALEEQNYPEARGKAGGAMWNLAGTLKELTATKHLEVAADRLGFPEFCPVAAEMRELFTPDPAAVTAYREAARALWEYTRRQLFEPIRDDLSRSGAADPDRLELTGDYPLFWPGNRIHEFGRVVAEMGLSFQWSEFEEKRENLADALASLWNCDAENARRRCEGLEAALKDCGHDVSHRVTPFLEDAEFERLCAETEKARAATERREFSAVQAERAVQLSRRLHRMVANVVNRKI